MAELADAEVPATLEDLFGESEDADLVGTEQHNAAAPITVEDLFGEEADLDVRAAPLPSSSAAGTAAQRNEPYKAATPAANLSLPTLSRLSDPSISQVSLVRMPKIVGMAPTAYDPDTYDEMEEMQYLKRHDKTAASESLVRFRFQRDSTGAVLTDANGRPLRESNTRIVEWQDGSLTLHVGKEVLSLRRAAKEEKTAEGAVSTEGSSVFVYARVQSVPDAEESSSRKETVLEAQAAVASRFTVGGLATSNVVQQSVLEARSSRSRALKRQRVAQIAVTEDLETAKNDAIRKADAEVRTLAAMSRRAEVARAKDRSKGDRYGRGDGLDDYLGGADDGLDGGEDDEDGAINLKDLKRKAKRGPSKRAGGAGGYDSQSQDDDEEDG